MQSGCEASMVPGTVICGGWWCHGPPQQFSPTACFLPAQDTILMRSISFHILSHMHVCVLTWVCRAAPLRLPPVGACLQWA